MFKGCVQYGYDIDDNFLVLKKIKIQFEVMGICFDELWILSELFKEFCDLDFSEEEVIENGIFEYFVKEFEEIVKDYLNEVVEKIEKIIIIEFGRYVLLNVVIDLVVIYLVVSVYFFMFCIVCG